MKQYLYLISLSNLTEHHITRNAGKMTQVQFNKLLNRQRALVKEIWKIRESGDIVFK